MHIARCHVRDRGAPPRPQLEWLTVLQGEEGTDVLEGDFATCTVHVCLERLASKSASARDSRPLNLSRFKLLTMHLHSRRAHAVLPG